MSYRPDTVARLEYEEIEFRKSLKNYRADARRRNRLWDLPEWLFRSLFHRACAYCDVMPARGVDRRDNHEGYTRSNSVPCCARCNYAKRDLSVGEFLRWLRDLAKHQGFLK